MMPIIVNHQSRFYLWFFAGCIALVGAGLKMQGFFEPVPGAFGMKPEMGIVYTVGAIGATMILYAIIRIPLNYTFDDQGLTISYLIWRDSKPWHEVSSIKREENDTSGSNIRTQLIAAIAGIPLIEITALVKLRSGKTLSIVIDEETWRKISFRWNKVWRSDR